MRTCNTCKRNECALCWAAAYTYGVASQQNLVQLQLLMEEAADRGVKECRARVVVVTLEAHKVLVHRRLCSCVVRLVQLDCRKI